MTSSVNKKSPAHVRPYISEDISRSYTSEKSVGSDPVALNGVLSYSHVDRLFQQTKTSHICIDPPLMLPDIERRLFLVDIICDYVNVDSYWESSLKKLENLPQDDPSRKMEKLLEIMANLSQISRDISNQRSAFQKG